VYVNAAVQSEREGFYGTYDLLREMIRIHYL